MPFTVAQPETNKAESNIPSRNLARIKKSFTSKAEYYDIKMNLRLPAGELPEFRDKTSNAQIFWVIDCLCR
jgi:acyl-CoA thioesterase